MRKIIIAFIAVLLLCTPAFAETKIAYVNVQKALNDTKAGAQAKKEIAAQAKEYETEYKIKEGELLKLKTELEKQDALLSDDAKREKVIEYQQRVRELQAYQQQVQRGLQQEDGKRTQLILGELAKILQTLGKDGDYSMIIEKSGLVYVAENVDDLTEALIKAHDASK